MQSALFLFFIIMYFNSLMNWFYLIIFSIFIYYNGTTFLHNDLGIHYIHVDKDIFMLISLFI